MFLSDKRYLFGRLLGHLSFMLYFLGEKMTEEEVNLLVSGIEDQQGQINYEGIICKQCLLLFKLILAELHARRQVKPHS